MQHDTTSPRPYSRIDLVQGTKGTVTGYPDRIHVEGRTEGHGWEDLEAYREEFDHPLWRRLEAESEGAGHGGMDFLEDYRLIQSLRSGKPMDMDVYSFKAIPGTEVWIDIDRTGGRLLTFGFGSHYCPGSHLAKAQIVAGGMIANVVLGVPAVWGMAVFTVVLIAYTMVGGMAGVTPGHNQGIVGRGWLIGKNVDSRTRQVTAGDRIPLDFGILPDQVTAALRIS